MSNIEREEELQKEREESLQRFNDFKERLKMQAMRYRGAHNMSQGSHSHSKIGGQSGGGVGFVADDPLDDDLTSESEDGGQFDENGRPLYDLQS